MVLDVIFVDAAPIGSEVAVGVIAEAGGACTGILVEAVGGIGSVGTDASQSGRSLAVYADHLGFTDVSSQCEESKNIDRFRFQLKSRPRHSIKEFATIFINK